MAQLYYIRQTKINFGERKNEIVSGLRPYYYGILTTRQMVQQIAKESALTRADVIDGRHIREARPPIQSFWKKDPDAGIPYSRTTHPTAHRTRKEVVQYSYHLKRTSGHTCGQYYGKYETWTPFP